VAIIKDLFLVKILKTNCTYNDKMLVNSGITFLYKMYLYGLKFCIV